MEIYCTIGPSTFKPSMVRMLWCAGVTVFRLNLSHTQDLDEISIFIKMVRNETDGKICLDTHGKKHSHASAKMPNFTKFDKKVLDKYSEEGLIDEIAVSFAQNAQCIKEARGLAVNKHIIAKIEDVAGLSNCAEITKEADAILIDRGDLSKSIPIEEVPAKCREIILKCKELNKPVYVATNLLESMVISPGPTMGEVNDIASLLLMDVDGLVLAAETAIGKHPIECVEFVRKMIEIYK